MKKFEIEVDETRIFRHSFIVEVESEEDLDFILDKIQSEKPLGINDYKYSLKDNCEVVESVEDEDGELDEIECSDISEL